MGFVKNNDASAGVERGAGPILGPVPGSKPKQRKGLGVGVVNKLSEDECASIVGGAVNSQ